MGSYQNYLASAQPPVATLCSENLGGKQKSKKNAILADRVLITQNQPDIWPKYTLPETNIAPKNGWLEYYFPIGMAYFQGLC